MKELRLRMDKAVTKVGKEFVCKLCGKEAVQYKKRSNVLFHIQSRVAT